MKEQCNFEVVKLHTSDAAVPAHSTTYKCSGCGQVTQIEGATNAPRGSHSVGQRKLYQSK